MDLNKLHNTNYPYGAFKKDAFVFKRLHRCKPKSNYEFIYETEISITFSLYRVFISLIISLVLLMKILRRQNEDKKIQKRR